MASIRHKFYSDPSSDATETNPARKIVSSVWADSSDVVCLVNVMCYKFKLVAKDELSETQFEAFGLL